MLELFRFKKISTKNIKSIEFTEDYFEGIRVMELWEIASINYDRKLKIYIIENCDGIILNPKEIKITYKEI